MDELLLIRFFTGELNKQEYNELFEWVNTNETNRKTFSEMKHAWTMSRKPGQMTETDLQKAYERFLIRRGYPEEVPTLEGTPVKNRYSIGYFLLRIAAVLLLVYGIGLTFIHFKNHNTEEYFEVFTRRGEKSKLVLSDGTKIWINSDSHLRYPTRVDKKKVTLHLDGEAYFEVAKLKGRKFIVSASGINITALGTSFNVKSYQEEGTVETTLEEGKIEITGNNGIEKIKKPIMVFPNQRITIYTHLGNNPEISNKPIHVEADATQVAAISTIDKFGQRDILIQNQTNTTIYSSWKDGTLQFRRERFEDLALLLERWYDVRIRINNEEIKEWRYTGTFDKETIEQALTALSMSMPFKYSINKNYIVIEK